MADFIDFLPLFQETEETIRARMDIDVNNGVATTDSDYVDTRQGSFYYDLTQAVIQEVARLYDSVATEVPATALPSYAWGEYLDYWASVLGLSRKDATAATGYVTFTGTSGTIINTDTQVAAAATVPDVNPPIYQTAEGGTIPAAINQPSSLTATAATTSGNLAVGTYYYGVTCSDGEGETVARFSSSVTLSGTGRVDLSWPAVSGATEYLVYRSGPTGATTSNTKYIATVAGIGYTDSGATATTTSPPASNTTGGKKTLAVQAAEAGTPGNVAAGAISVVLSPLVGVSSITNVSQISGGTDVETDEDLRDRVLLAFQPSGAGTANDYKRWALSNSKVGKATVVPVWNGAGTVKVMITDSTGTPVAQSVVDAVQMAIDPLPGAGSGLAPIGATVTVTTPATVSIAVTAVLSFQTGYSLDGASGTAPLRDQITAQLTDYINNLEPGASVIYKHVEAQFFKVRGVLDVTSLTVNGGTSNVTMSTSVDQVARIGTVTLS